MRQVLTNLVGNAIKFTSKGHVLVRVTGVPDPVSQKCAIHVASKTPGSAFQNDKIDHIFGEFNQVEDQRNREFEGTGLGLAISRRLIELMEGSVWVESEEGAGSVFWLPRLHGLYGRGTATRTAEFPGRNHHVMIVDDLSGEPRDPAKAAGSVGGQRHILLLGAKRLWIASTKASIWFSAITTCPIIDGLELVDAIHERGWGQSAVHFAVSSNPS